MPSWKTLKQREFLGACDIEAAGEVKVTIDHIKQGAIPIPGTGKKERQPVAMLRGKDGLKAWILNSTNCKSIERIAGTDDYTRWSGLTISIYVTTTRAKEGGTVKCIRVRPTAPKGNAAPLETTERPVEVEMTREPGEDAAPVDETIPT